MDVDRMSVRELQDWLAKELGYYFSMDREIGPIGWCDKEGGLIGGHPIPATLDSAAAVMPEGWLWSVGNYYSISGSGDFKSGWVAKGRPKVESNEMIEADSQESELEARFRLAVKARMAGGGGGKQ